MPTRGGRMGREGAQRAVWVGRTEVGEEEGWKRSANALTLRCAAPSHTMFPSPRAAPRPGARVGCVGLGPCPPAAGPSRRIPIAQCDPGAQAVDSQVAPRSTCRGGPCIPEEAPASSPSLPSSSRGTAPSARVARARHVGAIGCRGSCEDAGWAVLCDRLTLSIALEASG